MSKLNMKKQGNISQARIDELNASLNREPGKFKDGKKRNPSSSYMTKKHSGFLNKSK